MIYVSFILYFSVLFNVQVFHLQRIKHMSSNQKKLISKDLSEYAIRFENLILS